jgi:hypothetical protein
MKAKILILSILLSILFFSTAKALPFYPVKYMLWSSPSSLSVGTPIDLPIFVENIGLLADTYNITVAYSPNQINPSQIDIINSLSQIGRLSTNQIGKSAATLRLISSTSSSVTLRICAMSLNDANYNPTNTCPPSDCSYLVTDYYCLSGKCVKCSEIIVKTGMASLPEFDWFGLLQIILIASFLVLLKF